jgi:hypothetical protein
MDGVRRNARVQADRIRIFVHADTNKVAVAPRIA